LQEKLMSLRWEGLPSKLPIDMPDDTRRKFDRPMRAKVPGGWLIFVFGYDWHQGNSYGFGGLTFYPDPEHDWDGNSLP
jgi:hypothetical protein